MCGECAGNGNFELQKVSSFMFDKFSSFKHRCFCLMFQCCPKCCDDLKILVQCEIIDASTTNYSNWIGVAFV